MNTPDNYETFTFTVRSYECDATGAVTVANLGNYLQEAASLNAEHLGFNTSNFEAAGLNITWVMTHLRLKLVAPRPRWGATVEVLTFPRNARRLTAHRDFVLSVNGAEIGRATTEWVMIDRTTRRLVAIPELVLGKGNSVREPVFGPDPFTRLKWEPSAVPACRQALHPRKSDTDLNGHVNNTRYIAWCFDALGAQPAGAFDFELVFKNEMLCDEEGLVERITTSDAALFRLSASGIERVLARLRDVESPGLTEI